MGEKLKKRSMRDGGNVKKMADGLFKINICKQAIADPDTGEWTVPMVKRYNGKSRERLGYNLLPLFSGKKCLYGGFPILP